MPSKKRLVIAFIGLAWIAAYLTRLVGIEATLYKTMAFVALSCVWLATVWKDDKK